MALHRLTLIVMGVPNVDEVASYYTQFGLNPSDTRKFTTTDGGHQLTLTQAPIRTLVELGVGVDDPDDLDRVERRLTALEVEVQRDATSLTAHEPMAGFRVTLSVTPRIVQAPAERVEYNLPGRDDRPDVRAPGLLRKGPVVPRKLGHVVIGSTDHEVTTRFFVEGIGFKVSDSIRDRAAFMRCSPDHHNVFVQAAPVNFLHHTAWQVEDVDEVGRGAMAMLAEHPERHAWGPGRHYVGSNFFWYLQDPAGNFSEYYSDIDAILDDQLWEPGIFEGPQGLFAWGPPPPASFLAPEDLAAMMTGSHTAS
jgi:hypothetical protein